jgi:hypothetical protein
MQMPSPCDRQTPVCKTSACETSVCETSVCETSVCEKPLSCKASSHQAEEVLIGTAPPCQTYIFIECPFPWASRAFESKMIPQNLRALVQRLTNSNLSIRCFLINRGRAGDRTPSTQHQVLIYQRPVEQFCNGYQRWSFQVNRLEQVAALIRCYLSGQVPIADVHEPDTRDLFICTHGSRDQCCGRYGMPFYREALDRVRSLYMNQELTQKVNLWQVSHIGGHRFAPTLLDLPDGRYYGRLSGEVLTSILTRKGSLQQFSTIYPSTYRGWSLLPASLQPLELALILQHGWDWFDCKVSQPIITQQREENWIKAELLVEQPDGWVKHYQAELVKDEQKTVRVKASCQDDELSEFTKYSVQSLSYIVKQPLQLSA